jgi:hypothetical protein
MAERCSNARTSHDFIKRGLASVLSSCIQLSALNGKADLKKLNVQSE